MTAVFDLILRGGTLVTPGGQGLSDVGIRDGKIAVIGDLSTADAGEVYDATGLHVLPGVIDSQVHFREPGPVHKEDLETGARSAAMGGVCTVFEMPNTQPSTTTPDLLLDKLARAKDRMDVDHAFFAGATHENPPLLAEMEQMPGCCGVKVFMGASTGSLLVHDDEGVEAVLRAIKRRAAFHSEDEFRLKERAHLAEEGNWHSHAVVRDVETAVSSTKRLINIARKVGKRIHVLHISTAEEMDILLHAKDVASVEVLPNHLTLAAHDAYDRLGAYAQQNPPIREQRHQDGIWRALNAGLVDVLASDHAPHTAEEKDQPYPKSPSGTPGVQTMVPVMLTHVANGRLTLERFVDLTSAGPQRVFGMATKGRIAEGYDADFTVVDLKRKETITAEWSKSKCGWTPYDGFEATGWPLATIVRGRFVMRDGEITQRGGGIPVQFNETLEPRAVPAV
ncbi:MAG: dihydroorotase [Parvularculaceae bacterium]|nr:dihydroorotase [Parvularculaceae bacterium]